MCDIVLEIGLFMKNFRFDTVATLLRNNSGTTGTAEIRDKIYMHVSSTKKLMY